MNTLSSDKKIILNYAGGKYETLKTKYSNYQTLNT